MPLFLANPFSGALAAIGLATLSYIFLWNPLHDRFWLAITSLLFGGMLIQVFATTTTFMPTQAYHFNPEIDGPGWLTMSLFSMIPTAVVLIGWMTAYRVITDQPRLEFIEAAGGASIVWVSASFSGMLLALSGAGDLYTDPVHAVGFFLINHVAVVLAAIMAMAEGEKINLRAIQRQRLLTSTS